MTTPRIDLDLTALRDTVALGNRLLHHYGLGSYRGHVSARIPGAGLMLLRARPSVSLELVAPGDLMVMDLDGRIVEASPRFPTPVEGWPLHAEVYKARPEVNSVVHTHQKWCTVFGIAGKPVLPLQHPPTASVAAEPWPVYDDTPGAVDTVERGRGVARALGGSVAGHLRNHGMVFVGTTVSKAVLAAADGEQMAEVTWRAMLLGTPEIIEPQYLKDDVEGRFAPPKEDVRDGVARGEWGNQVWLDEHRDATWLRGVGL